jgi:predicted nucleic acid-binding protein
LSALLLDAGVWIAAVQADDAHHVAAAGLLERVGSTGLDLTALDLTLYEVGNVIVLRRSVELAHAVVRRMARICTTTLRADADLVAAAATLAAQHRISVYDAAYVAAARAEGWTLVSCDQRHLLGPGLAVAPGDDALA